MRAAILSAALVLMASTANADSFAGRASVIDADTLEIHGERIRILDIDTPESRQLCQSIEGAEWRCGQKAALAVADWIGARSIICETSKRDRYKRWLAQCAVGGENLAAGLRLAIRSSTLTCRVSNRAIVACSSITDGSVDQETTEGQIMFGLVTSSFPFYEGIELVGYVMGISGLLMFGLALVSRFVSRWTARKPSESDSVSVPSSAFPWLWRKSGDSYMAVGIAALLAAEFFEITSR